MRQFAILLILLSCSAMLAAAADIEKRTLISAGKQRQYFLYVADNSPARAPVILLLHGSGSTGDVLVKCWRAIADREGLILVGPEATSLETWSRPKDGPDFLRDVLIDVEKTRALDPRRIYLFGYSAGAHFALSTSMLESTFFAATAVYAGALAPSERRLTQAAERKIPIGLFAGKADQWVAFGDMTSTRDFLMQRGFPVFFKEYPYDHAYHRFYAEVDEAAWAFLRDKALEREPEWQSYEIKTP